MIRGTCTGVRWYLSLLFRVFASSTTVRGRVGQCTGVAAIVAATPAPLLELLS